VSVVLISIDKLKKPDWDVRFKRSGEWQLHFDTLIKRQGIREPLHVVKDGDQYVVVEGLTRFQAALDVGLKEVPCIVHEKLDMDPFVFAMHMNMLKNTLSVVSVARCFWKLYAEYGWSVSQIAKEFNLSRMHVYRLLKLNELPESVLEEIEDGKRPAFPESRKKRHMSHDVTSEGFKGGKGVRCPYCGAFPEKGKGKWIYFCPDHEDYYHDVLRWIYSGEGQRPFWGGG